MIWHRSSVTPAAKQEIYAQDDQGDQGDHIVSGARMAPGQYLIVDMDIDIMDLCSTFNLQRLTNSYQTRLSSGIVLYGDQLLPTLIIAWKQDTFNAHRDWSQRSEAGNIISESHALDAQ
ncbi:hypothetical protein AJ78_02589 [Emergomyces pasteurianus Ep9510]|uniref:Uncharacterized protein n=1 Tax=Emergomyces pasteurianus Ep9510 TaxID=1447872 RepID=A0A1J9QPX0_9EURO|nr:hypothetical protein AJ78_02589 [Emergomyces pasteurianus Ep9510]